MRLVGNRLIMNHGEAIILRQQIYNESMRQLVSQGNREVTLELPLAEVRIPVNGYEYICLGEELNLSPVKKPYHGPMKPRAHVDLPPIDGTLEVSPLTPEQEARVEELITSHILGLRQYCQQNFEPKQVIFG